MPNIRHKLLIAAPADKIYSAITSQEGLSAWWTPDVKAKAERDSIARFAFGPDYFKEMRITELAPPERVKWACVTGVDEWVGTTITFTLQTGDREALLNSHPEATDQIRQQRFGGEGAVVALAHDDWRDYTPMFAECNYTWGQFLRSLKLLCETGKGRPYPNQHRIES